MSCLLSLGRLQPILWIVWWTLMSCTRAPTPLLLSSSPGHGAVDVPRSTWIVLTFASTPDPSSLETLELHCSAGDHPIVVTPIDQARVVVNPEGDLPPGACTLRFDAPGGKARIEFTVAAAGAPAPVTYDRDNHAILAPFPDDALLAASDETATGKVTAIPPLENADGREVLTTLIATLRDVDGASPLAPIVLELPGPIDARSIPMTPAASVDPLASVQLLDIDPTSEKYGSRVPFYLVIKNEPNTRGELEHQLIVYPAVALVPTRQYALVVARQAMIDPSRPLEPSPFFQAALGPPEARTTAGQKKVGQIVDEVIPHLTHACPALRRDDLALLLRLTVRSLGNSANDLLAIRKQLDGMPPPTFTIDEVVADPPNSAVVAVVKGTWQAPQWRIYDRLNRDANGVPSPTTPIDLEFVLALPRVPLGERAPIIIYQHQQPGTANDVPRQARSQRLAEAGFAVIGFTDVLNRDALELGDITFIVFSSLINYSQFPDTIAVLANAEQLAFLRLIRELSTVDVLPIGAPDGQPELNVDVPLGYLGVSHGAMHGTGLLAFAPEIGAAALVVGGGRYSSVLYHQDASNVGTNNLYETVATFFPASSRTDFYVGLSLTQAALDEQEWLNRARFLYKEPLDLGAKTSLLVVEGVGDQWVPPYSTATAAHTFGIPHLGPAVRDLPFLEVVSGPLVANIDPSTTAAYFQFAAAGLEVPPSPGCENLHDGHPCTQIAPAALEQRIHFFKSAAEKGVAEIINPFE